MYRPRTRRIRFYTNPSIRREKMSKNNSPGFTVAGILSLALLCLACGPALAQRGGREDRGKEERELSCNDNWGGDRGSHCVIKEQTVAATGGTITVDGRENGGV